MQTVIALGKKRKWVNYQLAVAFFQIKKKLYAFKRFVEDLIRLKVKDLRISQLTHCINLMHFRV